jgi:hypothetical protein
MFKNQARKSGGLSVTPDYLLNLTFSPEGKYLLTGGGVVDDTAGFGMVANRQRKSAQDFAWSPRYDDGRR